MAYNPKFFDFALDIIENTGEITAKKMFREYRIYIRSETKFTH